MKLLLVSALTATIALAPSASFAKAGPEIPLPKQSAAEVINRVMAHVQKEYENEPRDPKFEAYKRECIVISVQYTDIYYREPFDPKRYIDLGEWSWVIRLVHPRQNDHSWTFQLRRDGSMKLLSRSV